MQWGPVSIPNHKRIEYFETPHGWALVDSEKMSSKRTENYKKKKNLEIMASEEGKVLLQMIYSI